MSSSLHPILRWAQRKDKIFLTLGLRDITNEKIDLKEGSLQFEGQSGDKTYEFKINFYKPINVEQSKWSKTGFHFVFVLVKKQKDSEYWVRLTEENHKSQYIQIDWDKWVDEDEEKEEGSKGLGDLDYDQMNNFNDSDDEEEGNKQEKRIDDLDEDEPLEGKVEQSA